METANIKKTPAYAATIEAAYLSGFDPSSDSMSENELYNDALTYLTDLTIN